MPIKDLKDEFVEAGQGQLHLSSIMGGCRMHYVTGPNGNREWQQLVFWGGHAPSNRQFVVNPRSVLGWDEKFWDGFTVVRTDPVPPMGDLTEAARAAARAVLEAMK